MAAVVVDVEGFVRLADDLHLCFLDGESGVDEKNGVAAGGALGGGHEGGETGLHGTDGGDNALGFDVDVYEVFHETGALVFEFGASVEHGVELGTAVAEGLYFGLGAHAGGGQPGNAHFHADETNAGLALELVYDFNDVANGGVFKVVDAARF